MNKKNNKNKLYDIDCKRYLMESNECQSSSKVTLGMSRPSVIRHPSEWHLGFCFEDKAIEEGCRALK
jgi:hypothetical protein